MIIRSLDSIKGALPYVFLAAAVGLCGWTFLRSEQYRSDSDRIFGQTYEVQWRATQIREHLTALDGNLRLAAVTRQLDKDVSRNVTLLSANISQLLKLDYVEKFLGERDTRLLEDVEKDLRLHVCPLIEGGTDVETAISAVADARQKMYQISGTAVAHAATLTSAARIASAASRNRLIFGAALAIAILGSAILHMRYIYARRRDQHQQSFAALYAHMTRSPVTALRLSLGHLADSEVNDPEMLAAARIAVAQLETVTNGMNTLAYAGADTRTAPLSVVLDQLCATECKLIIDATDAAGVSIVPAVPMEVVLRELVKNAESACAQRKHGQIRVSAALRKRLLSRKATLSLEVQDNGPGMPADVARQALEPLFTTRAGSHAGLGLPACAQMVSALKGRLTIVSTIGEGICIRIEMPVQV